MTIDEWFYTIIKKHKLNHGHLAKLMDMKKGTFNNNPPEASYDLPWDVELYNAFCDCYHDDGSNDERLQARLKELLLKFLKANAVSSPSKEELIEVIKKEVKYMRNLPNP